jgi:DNA-binding protein HU-beta
MKKSELIAHIAEMADMPKTKAALALEAFVKTVGNLLSKGDKLILPGFGSFDVNKRKKRAGRNPQTGKPIVIPAAKVPRFRAGKALKEKVNK